MGKILTYLFVGISFAAILLSGSSCNTGGCTELKSAIPRADFYSSSTGRTITVDSLAIIGIGAPGDSTLYSPSSHNSMVYLPMPPEASTVSWRFAYMPVELAKYDVADTITLDFDRYPWFAGVECGAMYKYRITNLRYTRYVIDSIAIPDSTVINVEKANLNIYFRTESTEQ